MIVFSSPAPALARCCLFAVALGFYCGAIAPLRGEDPPAITSVETVRNLPVPEAAKGLRCAFEAQVLHVGAKRTGLFIVQDGAGIYAAITRAGLSDLPFRLGSIIRVRGRTHPGSFIPQVFVEALEIVSWQPPPPPLRLTYDNLFEPELDCAWVELEGFVLGCRSNPPFLTLTVEAFGSLVDVALPDKENSAAEGRELTHRHIKLRGVAASQANDKRQLTSRNIRVQEFSEIELTVSRGSIPLVGVDKLLTTGWSSVRKVRLQGVVTSAEFQRLYLRGAGGSIRAKVRDGVEAKIGDIVEVLGTVSVEPFSPTLYAEQVTVLGSGESPEPVPFDPEAGRYSSELNNELIATSGLLLGIGETENSKQTVLQCSEGGTTFDVVLPGGTPAEFEPGSRLLFTGICQLIGNSLRLDINRIDGFRLSVRSLDDIQLLTPASWWTQRRVLFAFGVATAAALFAFLWAIVLRNQVAHQTAIVRSQVEREAMLGERQRIARELHDTVEQNMAGLSMQLDNVSQAIENHDHERGSRALHIAANMLHVCRTEARESVLQLRAAFTPGSSVVDLLEDSVLETVSRNNVSLTRRTNGSVFDLGHFRARHILRALQETVLNAAKHAAASSVHLSADYGRDLLTLTVTDDGHGFSTVEPPPPGHFGLIGIRERCQRIGATFTIDSTRDGTTVTFSIPRADPDSLSSPT